jgi:ribosomal protein S18 acetylase RimI-like enzyme
MTIKIVQATLSHINECKNALIDSELGNRYGTNKEQVSIVFTKGIKDEEIYVAIDINDQFLGYIWIDLAGIFSTYPYVRSIAVSKKYRGQGIGKKLLSHFEELGFKQSSKLFLLVSDFNARAKKLYTELGYQEIAVIPDLFKLEISEFLMMKVKA